MLKINPILFLIFILGFAQISLAQHRHHEGHDHSDSASPEPEETIEKAPAEGIENPPARQPTTTNRNPAASAPSVDREAAAALSSECNIEKSFDQLEGLLAPYDNLPVELTRHYTAAQGCLQKNSEACVDGISAQAPLASEDRFKLAFCTHLQFLRESEAPIGAVEERRAVEQWRSETEHSSHWSTGILPQGFNQFSGSLQQISGQFLERHGISQNLQNCSDQLLSGNDFTNTGNAVYREFERGLNGGSPPQPVKIWNPRQCSSSAHGVFQSEGDESLRLFTDFTSGYESQFREGLFKFPKFCQDYAKTFCAPAFAFYWQCDQIPETASEGLKKRCQDDAREAIRTCASGNHHEARAPKEFFGSNALELYNVAPAVDNEAAGTIEQNPERFAAMTNFTPGNLESIEDTQEGDPQQNPSFVQVFHEMYSTCAIMREAARSQKDNDNQIRVGERIASMNGNFYCVRAAPWTVDFKGCATRIQWADGGFDVAAAAVQTGTQVRSSLFQSDINKDLQADLAEGDQTAYLEAQRRRLDVERDNSYTKGAINTAHAGSLFWAASTFPTPDGLSKACSNPTDSYYKNEALNCGVAWVVDNNNEQLQAEVFANQKVKDHFYYKMADQMAQAAFNALMGHEQNRQSNDLSALTKQYEEFFGQDAVAPEYKPVNYCEQNPTAPSCKSGGNRVSHGDSSGGFGNIGFQNQGGGNFSFNKDIEDGFKAEEKLSPAERAARDKLGSVIGKGGAKSFNDDFSAPGAAKAKMGRGGGGAGGGGAGGGGGGGGSTAPAPKKASDASPNQEGVKKSKSRYVSGGGGGINYKPGGSANAKKKDQNPFSNMFGDKKGSRNVATTVDDIAPAKSQLFEKISKRYGQVTASKRLYEFDGE